MTVSPSALAAHYHIQQQLGKRSEPINSTLHHTEHWPAASVGGLRLSQGLNAIDTVKSWATYCSPSQQINRDALPRPRFKSDKRLALAMQPFMVRTGGITKVMCRGVFHKIDDDMKYFWEVDMHCDI